MKLLSFSILTCSGLLLVAAGPSPTDRARTEAIQKAKVALEEECQREAAGDWDAWHARLKPFRDAMAALTAQTPERSEGKRLLELRPDPPLFEDSRHTWYMVDPNGMRVAAPGSRVLKGITTVSSWLRKRNVDLIFVPVPKASEVYPDRLVQEAPPSRIVAPHIRKLLYELLEADVEVLDLLPVFLAERDKVSKPLYYATDPHWSNLAEGIAARAIAERLKRYPFVQEALKKAPRYRIEETSVRFPGVYFADLSASEQARVEPLLNVRLSRIIESNGKPFEESDDAHVIIIGDSYTHYSKIIVPGTGINALLAKEINQPTTNISSAGATLEPFKEIVRDRDELLVRQLVIVWILNNGKLTDFPGWDMPALPGP